jgi:hypothetical protein
MEPLTGFMGKRGNFPTDKEPLAGFNRRGETGTP